ncbi:ornithine cyclodeaminase family protein [Leucobacter weissii]|uniref:Ornithine cyclodeaminase family protein n=1 Tax=Leucobacter weissii TaxID=1983706 RepID=A0A939SCT8_9MICO|nr:ornithine cyclodeaminase family protein [Leucobacter weissii]MBO1902698.1 ornithine cyclodeaminase family protein [Leucobacter weissii]
MTADAFLAEPPTLFLTDADVEALADWESAIDALREAYRRPDDAAATPERAVAATAGGWQRVMPSAPPGAKFAGSKTIAASMRNGLASYLITLFDQRDSRLAALVDGNRITGLRTAATAAAALTALLPPRPVVAAVVGSGFEARAQLRAASRVADLAEVRVTSPTAANRERFATELSAELDLPVTAVGDPEAAVRGAGLVLCAARSRDETPTVRSDWVSDDATVVSVGSTTRSQRELDPAIIGRAALVVADAPAEVLHDSGDLIAARGAGFDPDAITVSLHDLLGGRAARPEHGIAVYKSTGSGFQDIVLAELLYDRAVAQGRGTPLPVGVLTIRK